MNNQFIQRVIFDWNRIDNDSYLKGIEAFKGIEKLDFNKPITFFVGENGSGKSTLLEALAVAHGFNPEGGTKNYVFSTHDTHSELCDAIRIAKGYRKEKWVETLIEAGIVKNPRDGVKILGNGELTKKLTVQANAFSASAKEKIEALGGKAEVI